MILLRQKSFFGLLPLSEYLRAKLIPWSRHNASERFIAARPKMSVAEMPDSVILKLLTWHSQNQEEPRA